jgi:hypothetical protein
MMFYVEKGDKNRDIVTLKCFIDEFFDEIFLCIDTIKKDIIVFTNLKNSCHFY